MLMGMLIWVVSLGQSNVAHTTSSISRFSECPRKGHLDQDLRVWDFLKKPPNRIFIVDSGDPFISGGKKGLGLDFTKEIGDLYLDAAKEIDANLLEPLIDEIAISVFVNSDHGHDKVTRR
mmetsp:Transcript_64549/g.75727  ORF Transcript_64549/g.75727 Transcript_64549/m.75727 type:complete len:120 (+) Transcript_64549:174-533(+)